MVKQFGYDELKEEMEADESKLIYFVMSDNKKVCSGWFKSEAEATIMAEDKAA